MEKTDTLTWRSYQSWIARHRRRFSDSRAGKPIWGNPCVLLLEITNVQFEVPFEDADAVSTVWQFTYIYIYSIYFINWYWYIYININRSGSIYTYIYIHSIPTPPPPRAWFSNSTKPLPPREEGGRGACGPYDVSYMHAIKYIYIYIKIKKLNKYLYIYMWSMVNTCIVYIICDIYIYDIWYIYMVYIW